MAFRNREHSCRCGAYALVYPTTVNINHHHHHTSFLQYSKWLPQVSLKAHTTILSTTSRTTLTQTFHNIYPDTIKNVQYLLPIFDGVSVVGFTCTIGSKTIHGLVKEKEKAKEIYNDAVARGESAGLLQQLPDASDIFQTSLGNIPAGSKAIIEITYLGELKHDAEVDGLRWTLPTAIASRYGSYQGYTPPETSSLSLDSGSIDITVDISLGKTQPIRGVQSPSHPIAMTMGSIGPASSASGEYDPSKASATLAVKDINLKKDFVLLVLANGIAQPQALLETHPTIPHQRALMVSLVPKFSLKPIRPEVVFVVDRSGSMDDKVEMLRNALKVFLKSLPVGVKFNVCSFGSSYRFLWPKSKTYDAESLNQALNHVSKIEADMGGTEMLYPIEATIKNRYKDIPLEVLVLTDGEIWSQGPLFDYINTAVTDAKVPLRVFSLGVGNDVSTSLVEGLARAGDGFAQFVQDGEKIDSKVVRMLKGALSPHIKNYALEVVYKDGSTTTDDDFEIIEKVQDSMKGLLISDEQSSKRGPNPPKTISLFDPDVDMDADNKKKDLSAGPDYDGLARFDHLPEVDPPKLLQVPNKIPTLYPFSRTAVYILLSPQACQKAVTKVVLTGDAPEGPLRLEIPVETISEPGETIHQLAAKRAVMELEEGRGWVVEATDAGGVPLKERFESLFDDMVQRECVRLGVQYQVAGKHCSFVAVESNKAELAERAAALEKDKQKSDLSIGDLEGGSVDEDDDSDSGFQNVVSVPPNDYASSVASSQVSTGTMVTPVSPSGSSYAASYHGAPMQPQTRMRVGMSSSSARSGRGGNSSTAKYLASPAVSQSSSSAVGGMSYPPPPIASAPGFSATTFSYSGAPQKEKSKSGLVSTLSRKFKKSAPDGHIADMKLGSGAPPAPSMMFGSPAPAAIPPPPPAPMQADMRQPVMEAIAQVSERGESLDDLVSQTDDLSSSSQQFTRKPSALPKAPRMITPMFRMARKHSASASPQLDLLDASSSAAAPAATAPADPLYDLIGLQTFDGYWEPNQTLFAALGITEQKFDEGLATFSQALAGAGQSKSDQTTVKRTWATLLAAAFFETKLATDKDTWELIVDKAKSWIEDLDIWTGSEETVDAWAAKAAAAL
jgi:hypothetical protein